MSLFCLHAFFANISFPQNELWKARYPEFFSKMHMLSNNSMDFFWYVRIKQVFQKPELEKIYKINNSLKYIIYKIILKYMLYT